MATEEHVTERAALESAISADLRVLSAESDQIGRLFAASQDVRSTDFRALLHVMVAETAGQPITSGDLRQLMGLSGAAITYLVDRMIDSGHLRRETHPSDRRKVMLRYAESGFDTARAFFVPLGMHSKAALADLSDDDLATGHRVFIALITAMRRYQDELKAAEI